MTPTVVGLAGEIVTRAEKVGVGREFEGLELGLHYPTRVGCGLGVCLRKRVVTSPY